MKILVTNPLIHPDDFISPGRSGNRGRFRYCKVHFIGGTLRGTRDLRRDDHKRGVLTVLVLLDHNIGQEGHDPFFYRDQPALDLIDSKAML